MHLSSTAGFLLPNSVTQTVYCLYVVVGFHGLSLGETFCIPCAVQPQPFSYTFLFLCNLYLSVSFSFTQSSLVSFIESLTIASLSLFRGMKLINSILSLFVFTFSSSIQSPKVHFMHWKIYNINIKSFVLHWFHLQA